MITFLYIEAEEGFLSSSIHPDIDSLNAYIMTELEGCTASYIIMGGGQTWAATYSDRPHLEEVTYPTETETP
jgi:hypothetical protein